MAHILVALDTKSEVALQQLHGGLCVDDGKHPHKYNMLAVYIRDPVHRCLPRSPSQDYFLYSIALYSGNLNCRS